MVSGRVPSISSASDRNRANREVKRTSRDRHVLVCASVVGVRVDGCTLWERRRHVQSAKDGIERDISSGRVLRVDDIEHTENAVVAEHIGLNGQEEVDGGLVLARCRGSDEWDRDVGVKVGRELSEE